MIVKLLTESHLEFLSLKGGRRASPESTHVKMLEISCHGSYHITMHVQCEHQLTGNTNKFSCFFKFKIHN